MVALSLFPEKLPHKSTICSVSIPPMENEPAYASLMKDLLPPPRDMECSFTNDPSER